MKDHYRAHQLSLWLRLIPELHRTGLVSATSNHNQFPDHNSSDLYEGVVRPDPLVLTKVENKTVLSTVTTLDQPATTETSTTVCVSTEVSTHQHNVTDPLGPWEITGYQAYSTALTVTIAIGCSLLILNILIFAKVYHKKDKTKSADVKVSFEDNKPPASVIADIERDNALSSTLHKTSSQHSLHKPCHHVSQNTHLPSHHMSMSNHLPPKTNNPPNGSVHQYMCITRSSPESQHLSNRPLSNTHSLPHSSSSSKVSSVTMGDMRV